MRTFISQYNKTAVVWNFSISRGRFGAENSSSWCKEKSGSEAWAPGSKMALGGPAQRRGPPAAAYWAVLVRRPG